jgi:DNA-binding transcriptional MerR regulator
MKNTTNDVLYTIGEVARLSGVPVKTIRYYSDVGVLPPSDVTATGYRLYSAQDQARLSLIRTLRAIGFDVPTITRLLRDEVRPVDAVQLQLEAVEVQLRTLQRQRAVIRAALRRGADAPLAYLERAQVLARLDQQERQAFLSRHLDRAMEGVPVDPAVRARFQAMATFDLPDDLSDAQLDAWLELAELATDESFIRQTRDQMRPFWEAAQGNFDLAAWTAAFNTVMAAAIRAVEAGWPPDSAEAQQVVATWLADYARAINRPADPAFAAWLLDYFETNANPRAARYWELIGILRGQTEVPPHAKAFSWLIAGLRRRVTHNANEKDELR